MQPLLDFLQRASAERIDGCRPRARPRHHARRCNQLRDCLQLQGGLLGRPRYGARALPVPKPRRREAVELALLPLPAPAIAPSLAPLPGKLAGGKPAQPATTPRAAKSVSAAAQLAIAVHPRAVAALKIVYRCGCISGTVTGKVAFIDDGDYSVSTGR